MPVKAQPAVLALDLGTSSVRAVAYERRGRMVDATLSDVPYRVDTRLPGQVSSNPDQLLALIGKAIDATLRAARRKQLDILAVGCSCYWHSLMGIDARGQPTTELFTWADTRSAMETRALRSSFDEHAYHATTGCFFHASFWPAKLRWLNATRPVAVRRTVRWISLGEYLYGRLFGTHRVSVSMASGTGLLDVHRCTWDPTALSLAGVSQELLSPLSDWDQPMSGLRPGFAQRWPGLRSIPWFLPIGDGAAANLGAQCVRPDWFCATVGTSGALRALMHRRAAAVPWGTWMYRLDRERLLIGGALSEGGNVIRWITDGLGLKHKKKIEAQAARLEPDSHGLTMLPFWAGERSPNWRGDARAVIAGLSLSTDAAAIVRAAMESITYQFADVYDAMLRSVPRPRAVVATGGRLVHSRAWSQMLADVLNIRVVLSSEAEASSRGVAVLALHASGRFARLWSEIPSRGRSLRPRPRVHAVYQAARQRQAKLYALLLPPPGQPEHDLPIVATGSGSRMRDLRTPAARH
jgi:gluconokinase